MLATLALILGSFGPEGFVMLKREQADLANTLHTRAGLNLQFGHLKQL